MSIEKSMGFALRHLLPPSTLPFIRSNFRELHAHRVAISNQHPGFSLFKRLREDKLLTSSKRSSFNCKKTLSRQGSSDRRLLSTGRMATSQEVRRCDYLAPSWQAERVSLTFNLGELSSEVKSVTSYSRSDLNRPLGNLVLNGSSKPANMKLVSLKVNGSKLMPSQFTLDEDLLVIGSQVLKDQNEVEIDVTVDPASNTSLSGLYKSSGNFCTQCEAEGFRNFMYFMDRPDVLSVYETKIIADRSKYPVLLSNGNLVDNGELQDGRHFVKYLDPLPKPSYLFAVVAGDFSVHEDNFVTRGGRDVALRVFVEKGNELKTKHAVNSLKRAFKWDEERFDREYWLDVFNIVAVSDFNMGAMENTSLNIFNSKCVLANSETSTDDDFERIEGIIGHEFFHSWSGNRVTCRDWFQLTLKEGLTVFRDQEFTSDLHSRIAKRIADVDFLRSNQFPEDDGPLAHPIRPDSYEAIDNFYTMTVYEKGAEVVRMISALTGKDGFRKGLNLYFERHDGQAVTCEDFVKAMEDANDLDLSQFLTTWYAQAGTPRVEVSTSYNHDEKTFTFNTVQHTPATPGQTEKLPFYIPIAVGLIGKKSGLPLPLNLCGSEGSSEDTFTKVLHVVDSEHSFVFRDIPEEPVASTLRGFSAPVKLQLSSQSMEDLAFLAGHDTDEFVRYDSLQELTAKVLLAIVEDNSKVTEDWISNGFDLILRSLENTLNTPGLDKKVVAMSLSLPGESSLVKRLPAGSANVDAIVHACKDARSKIFTKLEGILQKTYEENKYPVEDESLKDASARRALKNACLCAWQWSTNPDSINLARSSAVKQFESAENMTDRWYACVALRDFDCEEREMLFTRFYEKYKDDALVVNKWLSLEARSALPSTFEKVQKIANSPELFNINNPNNCYALLIGLANNVSAFHSRDGFAYAFLIDQIIKLDKINPQVGSRVAKSLENWRMFAPEWRNPLKGEISRLLEESDLSPNVHEVVHKISTG